MGKDAHVFGTRSLDHCVGQKSQGRNGRVVTGLVFVSRPYYINLLSNKWKSTLPSLDDKYTTG